MPFDLASAKPATGGFDLASAKPVTPAAPDTPQPPAPPERSTWQNIKDGLNIPRDVIARGALGAIAAPVGDIAGLAATGYEAVTEGGKGDGDMPDKFRDDVKRRITSFAPDNHLVSEAGRVIAPAGEAVSNFGGAIKDFAKGGAANDSLRGMAVNAAGEALIQAPGFIGLKGAPAVARAADTIGGGAAKAARGEAVDATRAALTDAERAHAGTQAARVTEANSYADAAVRTQRELDVTRQRTGVPTSDAIGEQVRTAYSKVMDDAKAARGREVDPLYAKAQEAAAAKEAAGARVNAAPAVKDIDEMLKLSENLPDLQAKLQKLRGAVEAAPTRQAAPAPIGSGKVSSKIVPPRVEAPRTGLTYQELDLASRYIKDIAFSGEAEGYGALIRNTAKKLSLALDKQIAEFVPEHAAATAAYRKMSEPMETLATRIGEALHETEGGLKGDAYGKVSAQDLPGRIFGKKDRVDQLVDALAGGKAATPEARAAAQAKVDTWVENWILDKSRGKAPAINAPGVDATLNAVPGARGRLEGAATREAGLERGVGELTAGADRATKDAAVAASAREKVRIALQDAEALSRGGSAKLQKQAYDKYVEAFRQSMDPADPRYRAGLALIDRAATLEEKTAKARKLAMGVAGLAGVGGAAAVGVKIPGAL